MNTELREFAAGVGALVMPDGDAIGRYEMAIERYEASGDAQTLREALLSLGIDAATIRWHIANRGSHMGCVCEEDESGAAS
jgi:hypothetical protein